MWEKGFRIVVFAAIYDAIYWYEDPNKPEIDLDSIGESYSVVLTPEQKAKVNDLIQQFLDQKDDLYKRIAEYTDSWNKTYDLVKAAMCTSLLELPELSSDATREEKKKVVNKYVQIVQDMVGGNNPNLVYAIVGKIYGV